MPQRFLRPGITTSEHWNAVSFPAQSLHIRLITLVDDYGRYDARPALLRSHAFPVHEEIEKAHVESMLDELVSADLITVYEADGKPYLQVERWVERARGSSKYPPPPGTKDDSQPKGVIYFVRAETSRKIKIGFTQWKIESRLGNLQTASAEKLSLIGSMVGTVSDERALHRRFSAQNTGGEWFLECDELNELAASCTESTSICAPLQAIARKCSPPSPSPSPSDIAIMPSPSPSADADSPSATARAGVSEGKNAKSIPTTPQSKRVAAIFHRKLETSWDEKEIKAYKKLGTIASEDLDAVEAYYAAHWPPSRDLNILRHNIVTFLNNFAGEVDRAHAYLSNPHAKNGHHPKSHRPGNDRNAGTLNDPSDYADCG